MPAAAVIPAPRTYTCIVAVKTLVVGFCSCLWSVANDSRLIALVRTWWVWRIWLLTPRRSHGSLGRPLCASHPMGITHVVSLSLGTAPCQTW